MKRYFQPVSTSNSPSKKPRRVFNPQIEHLASSHEEAVNIESSCVSKDLFSESTSSNFGLAQLPKLLSMAQQQSASSCPVGSWTEYPGIMVKLSSQVKDKPLKGVIAFDVDGTIIVTKSGKKFPVSDDDWKFWHPSVPEVLQRASADGYLLSFISNQGGLGKKSSAQGFQKKIDAIIDKINVPIDFICSLESDVYRKPSTGMWEFLSLAKWEKELAKATGAGGAEGAAAPEFIYVGDAAGRPASGARPKDFSDTDYKLALNLGIAFQTPEKFFLQSTQPLHTQLPCPSPAAPPFTRLSDWAVGKPNASWDALVASLLPPGGVAEAREVVLLVAPPASGKSTLARALEKANYVRVNQDELGNIKKCLQTAREAMAQGRSVVVDNTNLSLDTRRQWLALASEVHYTIRCINLQLPKELCMLLSTYRLVHPSTPPQDRRKIETVVFHKFFKDLAFPVAAEGYERVDTIEWTPQVVDDSGVDAKVTQRLYNMYLK